MQPEQWAQFRTEIQNKCVAYEYSDASDYTLADFIITLLTSNLEPKRITDELRIMVGSDYDANVTEWICARKSEIESPPQKAAEPMEVDQPVQVQTQVEEQPKAQKQVEEQPKVQKQVEEQPQHQTQQAPKTTPTVASKIERPKNRIFSQALGDVLNNGARTDRSQRTKVADRSRSRSPSRQSNRYDRSDRASRHERSSEQQSSSNDVFSRIGNVKSEERPSVFDRLGGSKASQIKSQISNEEGEPRKEVKRERCKYWPTCSKGNQCTFIHPTRVCADFPNCPKKASECTFIHPETEKPAVQQPAPPAVAQIPIPCKFFPYCSNPVCPYIHPMMPPQSFYMQQSPYGAGAYKVQVPCKNGDACTRPDCHFIHPKDPNPQSEIICKFDGACTRPNCFYKHTKENVGKNKVLKNNNPTNERQFSVPEDQVEERITVGNSADLITKPEETQPQQQTN